MQPPVYEVVEHMYILDVLSQIFFKLYGNETICSNPCLVSSGKYHSINTSKCVSEGR